MSKQRVRSLTLIAALAALFLIPQAGWANIVIVGPLAQDFEVEPGRAVEGSFVVQNATDRFQEVKIFQTDYFFLSDGRMLYEQPGQLPRSNADWITFSPQTATLPPRESAQVRFSIQVPDDAALKGTYWSVLMVQPIPENAPEFGRSDPGKVTVGITEIMRYAIQIAAHIGKTGTRQLKFAQIRLLQSDGARILATDLENTGERMLPSELWVELYESSGKYIGKFSGGKRRLYPGTSARFSTELIGLQAVNYKALIVVDCGGDDVFGASANLLLGR